MKKNLLQVIGAVGGLLLLVSCSSVTQRTPASIADTSKFANMTGYYCTTSSPDAGQMANMGGALVITSRPSGNDFIYEMILGGREVLAKKGINKAFPDFVGADIMSTWIFPGIVASQ
jgi:hypothetical protein